LNVADQKSLLQVWREDAHDQAIEIVQGRAEKQQAQHNPTNASQARLGSLN
jgi:hypothetical protein